MAVTLHKIVAKNQVGAPVTYYGLDRLEAQGKMRPGDVEVRETLVSVTHDAAISVSWKYNRKFTDPA